ncbi:MAG TPA: MerR family transcriptional regulator [Labilithrix sp.]|nr:MerR family transcriptional regulator [Labilithrix sp.]
MLPEKLYFRIGEVADLVGVEPHVLRYWEREFRSIRPTKSAKGQRVYSRRDVENLLRVRDLLYRDGFTIAGAKKRLQRSGAAEPASLGATPNGGSSDTATLDASQGADRARVIGITESRRGFLTDIEPAFDDAHASDELAPAADVRQKLLALRSEVEGFLAELSASGPSVSAKNGR